MITWSWLNAVWMMLAAIYMHQNPATVRLAQIMFGLSIFSMGCHVFMLGVDLVRDLRS